MGKFRVETVTDSKTGKIYAELYYPENESKPIAQTDPIYSSHKQAEEDIIKTFVDSLS